MERDPAASAIEAFRRATECTPDLRARNLAAIEARVAAPTRASARPDVARWVIAMVAVAAAIAAVWWGARWWSSAGVVATQGTNEQAIDTPAPNDRGGVATPKAAPATPPALDVVPTVAPPLVEVPRAAAKPEPTRAIEVPEPPPDDPLSREAQAVAEARAALRRDDLDAAAAAIDRHAREFPDGTMAPERMALAVRLQCARADEPAARAAAAAFLRARPDSAVARRLVDAPCENP